MQTVWSWIPFFQRRTLSQTGSNSKPLSRLRVGLFWRMWRPQGSSLSIPWAPWLGFWPSPGQSGDVLTSGAPKQQMGPKPCGCYAPYVSSKRSSELPDVRGLAILTLCDIQFLRSVQEKAYIVGRYQHCGGEFYAAWKMWQHSLSLTLCVVSPRHLPRMEQWQKSWFW